MSDVPTRLLRETLREAMTPPGPPDACLDADRLAAWSDGALSARERAAAAAHASGCARCQALLAAMVRTTPQAPARAWWKTPAFSWLMPIAVGAIALVVWINVPPSRDARFAATPAPAATAAAPAPGPAASADQHAAPQASADLKDTAARPAVGPIAAPPLAKPPDVPRQAFAAERRTAAPSAAPKETPPSSSRGAELDRLRAAAEPAPAAGPTAAQRGAVAAAPAAAPPPAPPLSANAIAPPTAAGDTAAPARPDAASAGARMLRDLRSTADQPAPVARAEILAKAAAPAAAPPQIVSPDPNVRWRILAGGRVDRSIDAGATWQAQSTGVNATPTAGAAPSPTVCWLVGPRGLVLLSIDGRTWQRVTFADAIDLTAVRASDALNATVTASDGRTFVTSDGGRTWRNGG